MTEDKDLLNAISKLIQDGASEEEISELLQKKGDNISTSRAARDVFERSLAQQYMKNTGVSVPDYKTASTGKLENYIGDILGEQNPALKNANIKVLNEMSGAGAYDPATNTIELNRNSPTNRDIKGLTASGLHEGAHSFDEKSGLYLKNPSVEDNIMSGSATKKLMKSQGIKTGTDLAKKEASVINEIVQAGHHANIPGVREGSFGRANLLNILKGRAVRAVPFVGPALAAGATMLATGDVSAATQAATPGLSEAENLGPEAGSPEAIVEDPTKSYEQRQKAIQELSKRRY